MTADDIRKLSTKEIEKKITENKEELFNLRFSLANGTLENPSRIKLLRREVARLKTVLKEKEGGSNE